MESCAGGYQFAGSAAALWLKITLIQIFFNIQEYLETLDLELSMIEDLIEFQKSYIITFDKINQYPFTKHFNLNILEYLNNDSELLKSTNYRFDFPENKQMSKETFLENI